MLTRERIIEEVKSAGLDWHRGFVVSDDSNRYEDLCRAIDALVRAECVPQWRDIETAPKDAVILLGYTPNKRIDRLVYEGRWHEAQQEWTSVNGFLLHMGVTHWMPLPESPGITAPQGEQQ